MDSYLVAIGSALWLGVLTSISPCPLATNIAAITFIGKQVDRPYRVLLSGFVYTLGRMVTYVAIGMLVVSSVLSIPEVAMWLQLNMNKILGPVLLVAGILLLGVIRIPLPGIGAGTSLQARVEAWGIWGAGLLGLLFALSFCPVSAALFFGSLIPLALDHQSSVLMPTVYGVGTALPVVGVAIVIAMGAKYVGTVFDRLSTIEKWARRVTAVVFIGVGLYFTWVYLLELS
ncbi:sulfite exporter TauE/SafE family protein [candidate division GN15 bacterium]|nr:sulfite exporter TauE/SafE family protein [candidate division GN15 bacterium]